MVQKIVIAMNGDQRFALVNGAPITELNPKELLLFAAADCAGRTVVSLLNGHVASLLRLELTMEGKLSTPTLVAESRFVSFNLVYNAECRTLKDQMVISRAIGLAHDKYCGLLQMLRKIAPVTHEVSIVTTEEQA